jgi:hypothetical protein
VPFQVSDLPFRLPPPMMQLAELCGAAWKRGGKKC